MGLMNCDIITIMRNKKQSKVSMRTNEVLELIKKIDKAEKVSSMGGEKQQKNERLQISPSSQTGIVFSLPR